VKGGGGEGGGWIVSAAAVVKRTRDEDEDELHWARHQNFTKDKDSNVVAPLGEIMGALCTYLDRRFGLAAAQATAILANPLKSPSPGPT